MREIATLQLGAYANYVGSHFWNFQDELLGLATDKDADAVFQQSGLDMDVLYRTGETRQGIATYTPRLVSLDLRGSLGALRSTGSLYDESAGLSDATKVSTWSGRVSLHRAERSEKNKFQQRLEAEEAGQKSEITDEAILHKLDEGVQSWTDYLKVQLHPRSVYEIDGVWNGVTPFDNFGCGRGLFTEAVRLEEFQERLRFFVEECDHLQGFQVLVDDSGGFSAVASDLLSDVEDEYGDISLMLFTVRPPEGDSRSVVRSLHDAVSFASMSGSAEVVVPLGIPQLSQSDFARYLIINDAKPFHTSAVYATAIHTSTLPFRMKSSSHIGGCDMGSLLTNLSYASRKVAHLAAALPAPLVPVDHGTLSMNMSVLAPLTPEVTTGLSWNYAAESMVIQGARLAGLKGPATVSEVMSSLNQGKTRQAFLTSHTACSPCPLPVPLPFPSIFGSSVSRYGDILSDAPASETGRGGLDVFSVPVATTLKTDEAVTPYLRRRLDDLDKLAVKRGARGFSVLTDWGLAKEDAEELRETLSNVLARYSNEVDMDNSE